MTTERILSAQQLRLDPNVAFSAVIKHYSIQQNSYSRWVNSFIIITKGILYVYSGVDSKKPNMIVLLGIFQQVKKVKEKDKESPTWVLHLYPHLKYKTMQRLDFGTEKLSEVDACISVINEQMDISKKKYFSIKEIFDTKSPLSMFNEDDSIDSSLSQFPIGSEVTLNPYKFGYCDLTCDNELSLENFIFNGTSEAAFKELFHYFQPGSFLVRQNEDRQILTVQSKERVLKYVLNVNPENKLISIKNQNIEFENLVSLLSYYREYDLPWYPLRLTIPYKLVDRDDWL